MLGCAAGRAAAVPTHPAYRDAPAAAFPAAALVAATATTLLARERPTRRDVAATLAAASLEYQDIKNARSPFFRQNGDPPARSTSIPEILEIPRIRGTNLWNY